MSGGDRRKTYEAAMTQYGLPVGAFDRFKPWYAAIALATLPLAREGFASDNGVPSFIVTETSLDPFGFAGSYLTVSPLT